MPVFIAFAAFLILVFGHRVGLPLAPWVMTTGPLGNKPKSPGQKSGVRTDALEMVLHHDSGFMEGRSLKGRFAGRELSSLNDREQLEFLDELRGTDSQGALLDRRSPDWRDRQAKNRARHESSGPRGGMTTSEAYDILGLKPDAKPDQIRAAHRRLMMKFHPDQGGSTYFAARINEAKEILRVRKSRDGA
jgi:hypothetical protein